MKALILWGIGMLGGIAVADVSFMPTIFGTS